MPGTENAVLPRRYFVTVPYSAPKSSCVAFPRMIVFMKPLSNTIMQAFASISSERTHVLAHRSGRGGTAAKTWTTVRVSPVCTEGKNQIGTATVKHALFFLGKASQNCLIVVFCLFSSAVWMDWAASPATVQILVTREICVG